MAVKPFVHECAGRSAVWHRAELTAVQEGEDIIRACGTRERVTVLRLAYDYCYRKFAHEHVLDTYVLYMSEHDKELFARWHTAKPVFIDFGDEHGFWRILRYDAKTKEELAGLVNVTAFVELANSGTTDFSSTSGPASV